AGERAALRVAVREPGWQRGGRVSGGLAGTDYGKKDIIGGYSLEFFERVGARYGEPIEWHFEPHVAEDVFNAMAKEAGVEVFYQHRLKETSGVRRTGPRISEIVLENGARFTADVFADAT